MKNINTLVIATRNKHKTDEIRAMLSDLQITLKDLSDFPQCPEIVEDAETLEGNAIKKARSSFAYTGLPSISDDSGLEVYYLLGEPGVRSARYAGEHVTYEDNNRFLLWNMRQVPPRRRQARFRTVIAVAGIEKIKTVEGICEGVITFEPRGQNGFGYDPLFQPIGFSQTYAEMTAELKNSLSHRARAIDKLKELLNALESEYS